MTTSAVRCRLDDLLAVLADRTGPRAAAVRAAGTDRSAGVRRTANLLQVSSAFGRAMESVDRARVRRAVDPHLGTAHEHAIAAAAEGYPFPTDLDRDPPVDGRSPPSRADLVRRAVAEGWPVDRFEAAPAAHPTRRETH